MKYEDYSDTLLYCAAQLAVVTSEWSEYDYFAAAVLTPSNLSIWRGDGTDNRNEINDDIYHAWNNTGKYIAYMRAEWFLVDDNNNPTPEKIPDAVPVAVKDNGLPLN